MSKLTVKDIHEKFNSIFDDEYWEHRLNVKNDDDKKRKVKERKEKLRTAKDKSKEIRKLNEEIFTLAYEDELILDNEPDEDYDDSKKFITQRRKQWLDFLKMNKSRIKFDLFLYGLRC